MRVLVGDETEWEVPSPSPDGGVEAQLPSPPAGSDRPPAKRTLVSVELYDLERDPGELHNLAEKDPRRAAELNRLLDDWENRQERSERSPEAIELDSSTVEDLKALGYLH